MRTFCFLLLIFAWARFTGQTQPVPLGARVNPAFTPPPTVISQFSARHPNILPQWGMSGEHYLATFSETQGSAKFSETYDRNGKLLSRLSELPVSDQPKTIRQYVNSVFDTEATRVWKINDSSGVSNLFVTREQDTIWFSMPDHKMASAQLSAEDAALVNDLAALLIMDVTSAQLTLVNSGDTALNTYARGRIEQAGKVNKDLSQLARAKNLKLPTELNAKQEQEYRRLSALQGSAYDKNYSKHMMALDKRVHKQLRALARHADDEELRSWARDTKAQKEVADQERRKLCTKKP